MPRRNRYGIIGPIYPEDLQPETVRKRASANPLTAGANRLKPQHTIITNSTYDGLIYNVERVIEIGGDAIDRLHFDEAWYAYARFNPIYRGRHAMFGDPAAYKDGRHCSRHIRPTNYSRRSRRPHSSTFATDGTRSSMLVSTSRS